MTARYRITVNQAAIAADKPAIHVHDTRTGVRSDYSGVISFSHGRIVQGEQQQDGARVWIEADSIVWERA